MPTLQSQTIATKIIDIVDDYVDIPLDGRVEKITEHLATFIDDIALAEASKQLDPELAYSIKVSDIKQRLTDGVTKLLTEL